MEYKKLSYHKILVFFTVFTIVTLISGCNGGVPPIEELYGTLDINSTPSGANVYLDGENTGQVTPIVLTNIDAGDHLIELRLFKSTPSLGSRRKCYPSTGCYRG